MRAVSSTISSPFDWPVPDAGPWLVGNGRHHVIVIGAEIGGLSAAALLAKRGLKVLVVEAHDRVGGYCSSWTRTVRGRDGVMGHFTSMPASRVLRSRSQRGGAAVAARR